MSADIHISIDVMGGDFGPRFCVPAALKFVDQHPDVSVVLVGQRQQIEPLLASRADHPRLTVLDAQQVVSADDRPGYALRHRQHSSLWRALALVAENGADACVSAGNTGALMAMSRYLIGTLDGMSRPAICKPIPSANGVSYLLDMGANLNCSPEQLRQFALMGSALAKVHGCARPSVALLNVGAETTKGNADIQQAAALLRDHPGIDFHGFVEGNQLYTGKVDVVVCDGFVGNVALKVSEGAADFILASLRAEFTTSWWRRALGGAVKLALKNWRERFDPSKYNGAALLGLRKTVIKSHGGADAEGFYQALVAARQQVQAQIPQKIAACLSAGG